MSARTVVNRLGWVVVTVVLVSAFLIFYYNIGLGGEGGDDIMVAGQKELVDRTGSPPVVVAEAVVVGPAGLAIPVAGVKPAQLVDT